MFQDNPLLSQLKQQMRENTPQIEGVIKGTDKGFGFIETDNQKSYFVPPPYMKKVMHGDRVVALLRTEKEREVAEPDSLIEPFLSRFVGRIRKGRDGKLNVVPDHPLLNDPISCRPVKGLDATLNEGDWVVAEMKRHPLKGDRGFYADVTEFITHANDHYAPWWVTLSRHQLEREAPTATFNGMLDENLTREDLSELPFVTIDSASTQDMDDALYIQATDNGWQLTIAIADPTAYVAEGSELDKEASQRAFTNYLPGFNIPMLPRELSDDLCSLREGERRPALLCRVSVHKDGSLGDDARFFAGWVTSHGKLVYDNVSDWLEQRENCWQPENAVVAEQITQLHQMALARTQWRSENTLVFKDRPDYRFVLDENGVVTDIVAEHRRIANRMVEESMILANECAAKVLADKVGFGIYNAHAGFDPELVDQAVTILGNNGVEFDRDTLLSLDGFCRLRRQLDAMPTAYLDGRIRRFQAYSEVSAVPAPHFGLGLQAYATWTSPIRKYGDMVNHRLLKAVIRNEQPATQPSEALTTQLAERRRFNRMSERDVGDWLYSRFLQPKLAENRSYQAEIIDVSRGGLRVRLLENGAVAFVPAPFIHPVRDELECSTDTATISIKGEPVYRLGDTLPVTLAEVRMETRNIVARPTPAEAPAAEVKADAAETPSENAPATDAQ